MKRRWMFGCAVACLCALATPQVQADSQVAQISLDAESERPNDFSFLELGRVARWLRNGPNRHVVVGPTPEWLQGPDYRRRTQVRGARAIHKALLKRGVKPAQIRLAENAAVPKRRSWQARRMLLLFETATASAPDAQETAPQSKREIEREQVLRGVGLAPPDPNPPGTPIPIHDEKLAESAKER